ncbi:hypothetical protein GCM10010428_23380 [Actinosynnema pretiosum subsp. pretiosum]
MTGEGVRVEGAALAESRPADGAGGAALCERGTRTGRDHPGTLRERPRAPVGRVRESERSTG